MLFVQGEHGNIMRRSKQKILALYIIGIFIIYVFLTVINALYGGETERRHHVQRRELLVEPITYHSVMHTEYKHVRDLAYSNDDLCRGKGIPPRKREKVLKHLDFLNTVYIL